MSYEGGSKLYPTKKGISLTVDNWLDLKMAIDDITTELAKLNDNTQKVDYKQHIGRNVFVTVSTGWSNVDMVAGGFQKTMRIWHPQRKVSVSDQMNGRK